MKIVFLAPFGIRPKGTLIARLLPLARELQILGDEVVIVAPPYTNPEDTGKTELVDGVRICNVELGTGNKILATLQTSRRMLRAARAERPDLVHLFKPKGYGGLAAICLALLNRIGLADLPLFVDTDDWEGYGGMNDIQPYSPLEKRLFDFQERWLPRRAHGVTVASRTLEGQVLDRGVSVEKVLYLPNCVEPGPAGDGSKVRERHGLAAETPVVLLYTRFFEFDQERLHRVFASISAAISGVRFLVVGKGRHGEEESLLQAARENGFADNLLLAGWIEPNYLPDYLAAADVAVYPLDDTLVNRAKCPAKLTEIMLAGCPVVADRIGQAVEYLEQGASGRLVEPRHPEEMAGEIIALLDDPQRRRVLGDRGREYLLANFRWQRAAGQLQDFYRSRIAGSN